ncbi:MAG: tRNA 2-thiouridine(34) synthase MnmA [Candidatus Marinimicrobia bacterium]|nr:tRNA 2-thiouridine(34) synthase MnmA [Candidatus Neomarinimicrobiota bacterium]MDP7121773.1 tRNA 2-thiouridine(34) synthase MnmA [Candidatus Neomarinimicrobiota bacterium]
MSSCVLVAMSGGVDSSVALLKIIEEGYDPIGVTMKLWDSPEGTPSTDSYCCSVEAINNAKLVCEKYDVPHYTLDFQDDFQKNVVDYLVDQYFSGNTPNPCIQCNTHLRWRGLIQKADDLNAKWIATGHYARIDELKGVGKVIRKGVDETKDQSYVLWGIGEDLLEKTLFPLGNLRKKEVREIARKEGLVTAEIAESQEICFIPDADYRRFLKEYVPDRAGTEEKGAMVSLDGEVVGEHQGLSQYTIGQRRKLGVTGPISSYVQQINLETNTITVAPREKMYFPGCRVHQLNWLIPPEEWPTGIIYTHIRYNHDGVESKMEYRENGSVSVKFKSPQFAVAPGQSAVFYIDDILLGGGIIA